MARNRSISNCRGPLLQAMEGLWGSVQVRHRTTCLRCRRLAKKGRAQHHNRRVALDDTLPLYNWQAQGPRKWPLQQRIVQCWHRGAGWELPKCKQTREHWPPKALACHAGGKTHAASNPPGMRSPVQTTMRERPGKNGTSVGCGVEAGAVAAAAAVPAAAAGGADCAAARLAASTIAARAALKTS